MTSIFSSGGCVQGPGGGGSRRPPSFFGRPAAPLTEKEKDAVKGIDKYDRQDVQAAIDDIKEFRLARNRLCNRAVNTGGHLTSDTFLQFFKVDAQLRAGGEMDAQFVPNLLVQQELAEAPEFERLHRWTEGDIVGSALAFVDVEALLEQLFDKVEKQLEDRVKQIEEQRQRLADALAEQTDIEDMIAAWSEGGEFDPEGIGGAQDKIDELQVIIEALTGDLDGYVDGLTTAAVQLVRSSMPELRDKMKDSADTAQAMEEAMFGFGQEPGTIQRMNAEERIKLAQRLKDNDRMETLAAMIGAMRRQAQQDQTRKVNDIPEEVFDVGFGDDLPRLLPGEYHNLIRPETELDFYRRLQEKQLMEYKMRGHERVGKGGIVNPVDGSYSMAGQPEIWSKAVGGALMAIAKEQDRPYYGIQFGSRGQLRSFDFRNPDDMTLEKVLDFMEFFFAGGTDFQGPLNKALTVLQEEYDQKQATHGDIVFVTDGQCQVDPVWLEKFKSEQDRLGFRVFGIMIGGRRDAEPLYSICDGRVVTVTDLLSGEDLHEFFQAI